MRIEATLLAVLVASPVLLGQVQVLEPFGTGCGGYGGQQSTISITPALRPGFWSLLQIDNMTPAAPAVLMIGNSRTNWDGISLPASLAPAGMPGCTLLVSPLIQVLFQTVGTNTAIALPVPEDPVIAATDLFFQTYFHSPGQNWIETGLSSALRARVAPLPTPTTAVTSITQFGITFTFAQPVQAGQFVNGDWFVVGPATLVDMQPPCITVGTRVMNGAMINPDPASAYHGYDGALFGPGEEWRYSAALNVAFNLSPSNPRVLQPNQSLIKVISNTNTAYVPQLETCSVLTCLADRPPLGSFRPPYAGPDHQVRHDADMIDWTALLSLPAPAGMPSFAAHVAKLERPWLDHRQGWPARYMHPILNMPDYGRDFTSHYNEAALMANVNLPQTQKELLVTRLIQIGIDCWGNVKNGCYWEGVGGHNSGRKLPILLAGALLHDVEMLAVGANYPSVRNVNGTFTVHFGEDCQTFYVQQTSATEINWGFGGYDASHLNLPDFGFSHVHSPSADAVGWNTNGYRRCCTANAWAGGVLCARMMGLVDEWAHPALFDYQDRFMQTEPAGWTRTWSSWVGTMWDTYRSQF